jgi:two-component system chemotaxis response regulator CheY
MPKANLSQLSVLIVDDSPHMRRLLNAMLGAMGLTKINTAEDGAEALKTIAADPPDIVVTDADMRPMDGIELVRRLRAGENPDDPHTPVIMVTGHCERSWVEDARDVGVDEFLAKPITAEALHRRLAEVILNPRPFVRTEEYVGPDRRRRDNAAYRGPKRREADLKTTGDGPNALNYTDRNG